MSGAATVATAWRIPLCAPDLGPLERAAVLDAFDSGFVSSAGPAVERFERAVAARVGVEHAVACASGTAALHLGLLAHDVAAGDEVWVSDLTFVASANAVRYVGGRVVLVDAEPSTWNLDADAVRRELEARLRTGRALPRAIVAVDLLGHPARLDGWAETARAHGVLVVEDAAEALGAHWADGRACGAAGDVAAFSFNGNKLVTAGGGGMLVTGDGRVAARARHLSTQAKLPGVGYVHDEVGYNYRLTNLAAALGLAQLSRIDEFLAAKARVATRYAAALDPLGVTLAPSAPWGPRVHWLSCVMFADAPTCERVLAALLEDRIEARPIWSPLHRMRPYDTCERIGGDHAGAIADRVLCLPSSVALSATEQEDVIATIAGALRRG